MSDKLKFLLELGGKTTKVAPPQLRHLYSD